MCNIFLSNLCFAPCPLCATVKKNFNSKMTKMNGNGLNMVFKVIKLTSKAVFHHLYQNILALFTINWPMFFKMGQKTPIFYQKIRLYLFRAMSPICNTFLGSLGVAHWVHPVYIKHLTSYNECRFIQVLSIGFTILTLKFVFT